MLENFIYAKEKSLFEEALNNGEVLDEAIVFIEDTKEIWTHGSYFSNLDDVLKITKQSLTEEQKAQVKANLGIAESGGPLLNEEYGKIVWDASQNGSITQENYTKLKSAMTDTSVSAGSLICEVNAGLGIVQMFLTETGNGIAVYAHTINLGSGYDMSKLIVVFYIKKDLTIEQIRTGMVDITSYGDGTRFLANDGQYKEIETGISDAPQDGNLYGRILGDWGIIKQDTLDTYTISSDGQIFNFTKNLEKGIVQYAEIYNPLGTEATVYIKRDTDTRQVEVKIAPGATVLFRIISGIKGFYLEKVYYSYL